MTVHPIITLLVAWTMFPLSARTWTDIQGRKIEAELVRVEGEKAIVKIGEKEAPLAIARLSTMDQKFLEEWSEKNPSAPSNGKNFAIAGQELKADGDITTIRTPISQKTRIFLKIKDKDSVDLMIGIAVPPSFDPNRPQRVLWMGFDHNIIFKNAERHLVVIDQVKKLAIDSGWVVIAVDTSVPLRNDGGGANAALAICVSHINMDAAEVIQKAWPNFKSWSFICGGIDNGAFNSQIWSGFMLRSNFNLKGLFNLGYFGNGFETVVRLSECKKSDLKKMKIYVCPGGEETKTPQKNLEKEQEWRATYDNVKFDVRNTHDYPTPNVMIDQNVLKAALSWLAE